MLQNYKIYFKYASIMKDFYNVYGSKGAKLIAVYRCYDNSVKLYQLNTKFIVTKNRRVFHESSDQEVTLHYFRNMVECELPGELFNPQIF